jgi:hypothetical protein
VGRPAHGRSRSKKGESIDAACRQIELGDRLIEVEIPDNVASELKARKVSHETRAYEVRRVKSHLFDVEGYFIRRPSVVRCEAGWNSTSQSIKES